LLHVAVEWDNERLVDVALAHGANRLARDHTWNGTALDWAEHLGRPRLATRLQQTRQQIRPPSTAPPACRRSNEGPRGRAPNAPPNRQ
jgi:hypothetical protein